MFENLKSLLVEWGGWLIGGIKVAASSIVARVLAAFGLTWVSYSYVLPDIKSFIQGYATALPTSIQQLMGAMGVDVFITMILSAVAAKMGLRVFLASVTRLQDMIGNAGG